MSMAAKVTPHDFMGKGGVCKTCDLSPGARVHGAAAKAEFAKNPKKYEFQAKRSPATTKPVAVPGPTEKAAIEPLEPPSTSSAGTERAFLTQVGAKTILTARATVITDPDQMTREVASAFKKVGANKHFLWVQGNYVEANQPNGNGAFWTADDLQVGEPTVDHGPVNMLHQERHIIGTITGSQLVREAASADAHIVSQSAIWKFLFPGETAAIERASQIGQLYQCVDEKTELLTSDGWRLGSEIGEGTVILTLNDQTHVSEWLPVQKVHRYDLDGQQVVHMKTAMHSSVTTPNHKWLVRDHAGKWLDRTSVDLKQSDSIPRAVPYSQAPTTQKYQDAFVELAAWYWTEGSEEKAARRIYQSEKANPLNVARIETALKAVGATYSRYKPNANGVVTFRITGAAAAELAEHVPGRLQKDRYVRENFILALTAAQLHLFIETCIDGDGTRAKTDGQTSITQQGFRGLRSFEMACALAGIPTNTRPVDGGAKWRTCLIRRSNFVTLLRDSKGARDVRVMVPHFGVMWCPQTDNGTFLARRDGSVYWTRNSMECQAESVVCQSSTDGKRVGCDREFAWQDYQDGITNQPQKVCTHIRERSSQRRFATPSFLGTAMVLPPAKPAWGAAGTQVMKEAATLIEGMDVRPNLPDEELHSLIAQVIAYGQGI
jgi:hypothetical protein